MSLERRYPIALLVYAVLGIGIWFSMSSASFPVHFRFRGEWVDTQISFRVLALIILGLFAFKTALYRKAEQIRNSGDELAGRE
jgi:hypothetical protein